MIPRTRTEALTNALILAITAPTDEQADRAGTLADALAVGLTPAEIEACKADALAYLDPCGPLPPYDAILAANRPRS